MIYILILYIASWQVCWKDYKGEEHCGTPIRSRAYVQDWANFSNRQHPELKAKVKKVHCKNPDLHTNKCKKQRWFMVRH